jgi:hypothetical protein
MCRGDGNDFRQGIPVPSLGRCRAGATEPLGRPLWD